MFYFLFQYLTLSARSHYAEELVRAGWLDESAVVSDAQLEMMYGDMMTEALEGSSPEFAPAWSTDGDSQRTISLDEEEVGASGGERWTDLTPVIVVSNPPASPSTPPPSQPRRSGAVDVSDLAAAASAAARATRHFAPEAAEALAALAAAARGIGMTGTRPLPHPATTSDPTPASRPADDAASGGAAESGASGVTTSTPSSAPSGNVQGSPPPYFGETPTCIICTDEMPTPGMTNVCSHRECCRRCLWQILRHGDRRCPLCRRQYQRVW